MAGYIALKLGVLICVTILQSLPKTVISQRIAPVQFKSKVDEIAKAYTEGYKAAINAMRARSMIPRTAAVQRNAINPRSFIPRPMNTQIRNQPVTGNGFGYPAPEVTVNGVEKSGIPRPQMRIMKQANTRIGFNSDHSVFVRSAATSPLLGKFMEQQTTKQIRQGTQQRSVLPAVPNARADNSRPISSVDEKKLAETARLNAAARHRNVYFDSIGGDPYGSASGVLSRQTIHLNRNRRSLDGLRRHLHRARRSRMPYFGQDLDKIGVVRAVPVMKGPDNSRNDALPSFMKVHAAEFGSVVQQNGDKPISMTAEKKDSVMTFQQPQQMINTMQNLQQRSFIPAVPEQQISPENDKRDMVARLNQAARHRNVYLDSMSGDPYGSASGVLSRQSFLLAKHK